MERRTAGWSDRVRKTFTGTGNSSHAIRPAIVQDPYGTGVTRSLPEIVCCGAGMHQGIGIDPGAQPAGSGIVLTLGWPARRDFAGTQPAEWPAFECGGGGSDQGGLLQWA